MLKALTIAAVAAVIWLWGRIQERVIEADVKALRQNPGQRDFMELDKARR